MKARSRIIITSLILFLALVFIWAYKNVGYIETGAVKYVALYGYPAVLVLSFIAEIIDQPIGPDIIGSIGLSFGLSLLFIFPLLILGTWCANLFNFYMSNKYLSGNMVHACEIGRYKKYCNLFEKYGKYSLLFSAVFLPYIIFIWISGIFHMKLSDFFVYGMIPRALRILIVLLIAKFILGV